MGGEECRWMSLECAQKAVSEFLSGHLHIMSDGVMFAFHLQMDGC